MFFIIGFRNKKCRGSNYVWSLAIAYLQSGLSCTAILIFDVPVVFIFLQKNSSSSNTVLKSDTDVDRGTATFTFILTHAGFVQ